ncbi:hypothetical protein EJ04DRAFT_518632 [Polyplosphaeria fusca]|uniref:Uncharacterized protein n=1 Tax=Polyplosphaeria fusca TaxID=682080 RepID=A0A9P4R8B7_9PLEO|nr:hypothetical protein EJ04DRAFT_518632 [Polyplosphaeria fusca]
MSHQLPESNTLIVLGECLLSNPQHDNASTAPHPVEASLKYCHSEAIPSWRTASSSPPSSSSSNLPPASGPQYNQIEAGGVYWLTELHDVKPDSIALRSVGTNTGLFSHPAVVLGKEICEGEEVVWIRGCTSFGGRGIGHKRADRQDTYRMVEHADVVAHNNTEALTLLPGSRSFSKPTFVNWQRGQAYKIEVKYLEDFGFGGPISLSPQSVERMLKMGKPAPVLPPGKIKPTRGNVPRRGNCPWTRKVPSALCRSPRGESTCAR